MLSHKFYRGSNQGSKLSKQGSNLFERFKFLLILPQYRLIARTLLTYLVDQILYKKVAVGKTAKV